MEGKKKKKLPILILLGLLLVCAVFSGLLITGTLKVPTVGGQKVDIQTAALIKKASNVSDEMTLRELLLLDLELDITVTEDIVVSDTFLVKGNKTLRGEGTLSINAAGKFQELYILEVQKKSILTMDGLTLDGTGMGSGIQVNQRAKLVYNSGGMENVYKGITTNGEVTVNDINMKNISSAGIYSSFRSQVYLNGGTYTNAGKNFVNVTTGGSVEVNGGTYKGASGTALTNAGVMVVHDANISDIIGNAIYSSGELTTDYQGDKENGYIEISNITATAISINSNMDVVLSDIHVNVSGSNSLYVGAIVTGCTVKVDNCIFEKSKANSISSVGDVTIKNTSIIDAGDGGVYLREGGKLKLENVLIQNCKGRGIRVLGSTLKAEKVEIINPGTMGISVNPTKSLPGKATLSEIHISGAKSQNLYMNDETEVTIKDSVLEKSKRTNVAVTDGTLTMENVQVLGNLDKNLYAVQVGTNATVNMKGNSIITGATLRGVQIGTKATFNMFGGSICNIKNEAQAAAVWVTRYGTFNMKGGTIYGNYAKKGPGAVTVHGVMNMSGGTIRNNESGAAGGAINIAYDTSKGGTWGTFTMTGGTIKNNIAATSGGGVHVSKDTTANLYGGTITGNEATTNYNSSGVLNNGKVTIKGSFFMGEDKMYLNRTNVVLNIKGNTLKKHNANKPLLVVPCESTNVGTAVVKCDNNTAAVSLLNNYVKSGVRSFTLKDKGDVLTVTHNAPDMDMTDAETVHVKTFAELRTAIKGTRTKRIIVICADIEMTSAITVPSGTTVAIRDDGVERVIKRKDGNSSAFFTVYYGTGIILKSTTAGNLVVNGEHSEKVKEKDLSTLITAYGTTVFEDVAFENNEIHGKSSQAGAFLYQRAGSFTAIGSSFTNGYTSKSGGAMYLAKGDCYIKDCIFEGNEAGANAGAISTWEKGNVPLTIENTIFKNNKAGSQGGAVNQIAGKLTVIDCTFENNQSKSTGGAIKLNGKAEAVLKGTDAAKAVFKNNAGSSGGAIYLYQAQMSVDGYTFEANTAKNNGGAIYQDKGASDVTASNTTFKGNTAKENGGAICIKGNVLNLENCLFEGNVSQLQGGAIYQLEGTPKVTASNTTFKSNTANGHGGAMYLARGEADIKESIYEGNQSAKDGGAICTEEKGKITLTIENTTFKDNKANTGGAIRQSAGRLTVTDCTFEGNQSTSTGGSIVLNKKTEAVLKGTDEAKAVFKNNTGSSGGAIYLYQAQLSVDGYTFEGNTANNNGGAIYQDKGASDVTASNTTFKGNTANENGGAICIKGNVLNLENCLFEGNVTQLQGGAIYQLEGTPKVTASNTTFKSNTANGHGGAMYLARGEAVIKDSIYEGNQAVKDGGAICTEADGKIPLTIENTTFKGNQANTGGAIRQSAGTLTVTDCTFESNQSTSTGGSIVLNKNSEAVITGTDATKAVFKSNTGSSGGAIYLFQAQLSVDGYKFEGNTANSNGGAIYQDKEASDVTATNTTFNGNTAKGHGGAICIKGNVLDLENCLFEGNVTQGQGGAIYQLEGTPKVTASNTTFKSNTANGHGGAMYLAKGEDIIKDCIYEGNQAVKDGGAICTEEAGNVPLRIENATFKDNKANTGGAIRQSAGTLTVTDCTFGGNQSKSTGGSIVLNKNSEAVITGTDATKAVFKSNTGSSGGAIYLYQAQLSVDGYKFEGNTAKNNGGAIYQDTGATNVTAIECTFENNSSGNNSLYNKTKTLVLTDCTFTNDFVVNAEDSLTTVSGNTTGATFVYTQKAASVAIGSAGLTGNITIKPSDYSTDYVVVSGVNATVKDLIQVAPNGDAQYTLTDDGKLKAVVAEADKVAKIGDTSYDTLSEALAAAKLVGNTTVDNPVVITVLKDVELTATETITNHVKLTTLSDSAVTITRNTAIYMFQVGNADNKGTGSLAIDGKITIDGNQSVDGTGTNLILHYGEALSIGADVIVQNSTSKNGPAIYSQYGKVTLKGTFKGHTYSSISSITKSGGVLRATAGTVYIEGTEDKPVAFTGNQGRYGGAIRIEGATLYVNHAVFNNNTARDYGGVIFINDGSTVHIQNTEFTSNESKSTSISGGAIYIVGKNGSSKLTLEDCQFKDNIAKVAGTAICNDGGTVNISDCSFVNDTYAHRKNSPKTVLSGTVTGLTIADLDKHITIQIGAGGLQVGSDVTRRLLGSCKVNETVVLSKGTDASDADLARAAELVEIEQTGATATTWLYIAADGKLAQGIEAGAVTVATVDELKEAIAQATDSAIIYIMGDMTISAPIEIGKNITLKSMKPVTLTRDGNVEMFIVGDATNKGVGSLNLGGRITLDANKAKSSSSGKNLIVNYGEAVTVGPNVIIKNYKDTNNGAAIRNDVGTITVRGTIADNESTYVAGVRMFGGTLRVEEGAKFTNNVAKYGGAIYGKNNATVFVDGAEFNANKASHGGAALYFDSNVTATFTDTDFLSNQHTGTTNGGGAIMQGTSGTSTTMTGCRFEGNTSSKGQSVYNGGVMKLTDCTFVNQTFLNRTKTGKTTISGSIKGVTFVYDYNQASVVIGEGGINSESDITVQLHKDCAVGGAVLEKATNTTVEQLASAAEIIKVAQAEGYTPETWRYVNAEGKLAQGVSTGAVALLKSIFTALTDAIL